MDDISLGEFESRITSACAYSPIIIGVSTIAVGVTWLRLRAYLVDGSFIDTFYNAATGKTAYALISNEQRIFGADNTGGWHWHPFDAPENHIPVSTAIKFDEFLRKVEDRLV